LAGVLLGKLGRRTERVSVRVGRQAGRVQGNPSAERTSGIGPASFQQGTEQGSKARFPG